MPMLSHLAVLHLGVSAAIGSLDAPESRFINVIIAISATSVAVDSASPFDHPVIHENTDGIDCLMVASVLMSSTSFLPSISPTDCW